MCLIHIGKKKYIESAFLCIGAFVIISASNNDEISFHMLHIIHIYIIQYGYGIWSMKGKEKVRKMEKGKVK